MMSELPQQPYHPARRLTFVFLGDTAGAFGHNFSGRIQVTLDNGGRYTVDVSDGKTHVIDGHHHQELL